ncbi:flagellar motor switch protein FliM [Inmirania thermothiophila]|uniref:Flagellar motor switch protein FliM n=1 Tax=Inmirania thermothiophila TaxID=1750597 RepID=A0A3N1Y7X7_9GAMM|nr:flagellar motor switch protein FliM [Inmirania thermothiophila]ROR34936.1 flagellar motor switch protein FliM [Inmirania thermothiophila]
MSVNDLLSQEEIDALLAGVSEGEVPAGEGTPPAEGEVRPYDFTSQDRIVRGRLPGLDVVNERLARHLRGSLSALLRRPVEVKAEPVQTLKFGEYAHSLYVPSSINLLEIQPLHGTAMLVLDPKLVYVVVDHFFGGGGRFGPRIEGREFTATERRVIQRLVDAALADLARAWEPVLPLRVTLAGTEINPHLANIAIPAEVVVVSAFRVELEGGGGGALHVTFPYAMLEPVREHLDSGVQSDRIEVDEGWAEALREQTKAARVELVGVLAQTEIALRDVLAMKPGDVIPLDPPELVTLHVEGIPMFLGRFGSHEGANAVRIERVVRRPRAAGGGGA